MRKLNLNEKRLPKVLIPEYFSTEAISDCLYFDTLDENTHLYRKVLCEEKLLYEPCFDLRDKTPCAIVSEMHETIQGIIVESRSKTVEEQKNDFFQLVREFQNCLSSQNLFSVRNAKILQKPCFFPKEKLTYGIFTINSEMRYDSEVIVMKTQDLLIEISFPPNGSQLLIELQQNPFNTLKYFLLLTLSDCQSYLDIDFRALYKDCSLMKVLIYSQLPRLFKASVSSCISPIFNIPNEELSDVTSSIDVCNIINQYLQLDVKSVYDQLTLQSMYYNPQFVTEKLFNIVNIPPNCSTTLYRWLYYQLTKNPEKRLLNCGFTTCESDENGPQTEIYIYNHIERQFVIFYLVYGKIKYRKEPISFFSFMRHPFD